MRGPVCKINCETVTPGLSPRRLPGYPWGGGMGRWRGNLWGFCISLPQPIPQVFDKCRPKMGQKIQYLIGRQISFVDMQTCQGPPLSTPTPTFISNPDTKPATNLRRPTSQWCRKALHWRQNRVCSTCEIYFSAPRTCQKWIVEAAM